VVAHEHIGIQKKPTLVFIDTHPLKVPAAIAFVTKDVLSLIASDNDVIERSHKLYARSPCHAIKIVSL
jgi:hypothetical protein